MRVIGQYYKYVSNGQDNLWLLVSMHEYVCMFEHISGPTSNFVCVNGLYPFNEGLIEAAFIRVGHLIQPIKHLNKHTLC
jgi:hypothetical protein